jgi:hypothetical protein
MGQYDVHLTPKRGGCCRHRFWGWKEMLRYDYGSSAAGATIWSRVWWLLIIRFLFALWSLAAMIYGMVIMGLEQTTPVRPWWWWGITLGNWALFSVVLYFWSFFIFSCNEVRHGAFGKTNLAERYLWVNYEIAWALTWISTLLFWLYVARSCTYSPNNCSNLNWYDYHVYGISLGWLLIEVWFNMMRWKWLHFLFPLVVLTMWFVFSAIFHQVAGEWPYPEQDTAISSTTVVGLFYPLLILGTVLFHMCGFGCGAALEKCYKGKRRITDKDMAGDNGSQLSQMCCG